MHSVLVLNPKNLYSLNDVSSNAVDVGHIFMGIEESDINKRIGHDCASLHKEK